MITGLGMISYAITNQNKMKASYYPNLFRALEIAKLGGYTMSVFYDKYDYEAGADDYQTIKDFCKGWFDNFSEDGDMNIEICFPKLNSKDSETIANIQDRIDEAKLSPLPDPTITGASEILLKNAIKHLNPSLRKIDITKKIAQTIAQLEGASTIEAVHIGEAMQYGLYLDYKDENYINAEKSLLIPDEWISIKDELPEHLETVWIANFDKKWVSIGCLIVEDDGWHWAETNGHLYVENEQIVSECESEDDLDVTYWRKLPKFKKP